MTRYTKFPPHLHNVCSNKIEKNKDATATHGKQLAAYSNVPLQPSYSKHNSSLQTPPSNTQSNLPVRRDALFQLCHDLGSLIRSSSLEIVAFALCGFVNDELFLDMSVVSRQI